MVFNTMFLTENNVVFYNLKISYYLQQTLYVFKDICMFASSYLHVYLKSYFVLFCIVLSQSRMKDT